MERKKSGWQESTPSSNTRFAWAGKCLEDMRMVGFTTRDGGPYV